MSEEDKHMHVPLAFIARQQGVPLNTLRYAATKGYIKAWKQGRDWFSTLAAFEDWNTSSKQIRRPRENPKK